MKLLAQDDNVDIVTVIFIPPVETESGEIASVIREIAPEFRQRGKTIVASLMGSRVAPAELSSQENYVPCFAFPENIASALIRACEYGEWLKRPKGTIPKLENTDRKRAEKIVEAALERSTTRPFWLDTTSTIELLEAYGISTVQSRIARTPEEAMRIAHEIGFPVVLKLLSATITHKTDVGGVILDLRSEREVEVAFKRVRQRLTEMEREAEMEGVLVQKMVSDGVETIVGVTEDPSFGPLIMFGMGGIYAELFRDVTFRIHPLTDVDAREMVRSVNAYHLLEGWRGAKPCDTRAIEELLLRVSQIVEDLPQIAELDLNPVKVMDRDKGYVVVDARVSLS